MDHIDDISEDDDKGLKSSLVSCNVTILGRRTSVRLDPIMWKALHEIAQREKCRVHDICSLVHLRKSRSTSLTAAIRVFLMLYYRAAATEEGHSRAGHGNFRSMLARARIPSDKIASSDSGAGAPDAPERVAGRSAYERNGQGENPGVQSSDQPPLPVSFSRPRARSSGAQA